MKAAAAALIMHFTQLLFFSHSWLLSALGEGLWSALLSRGQGQDGSLWATLHFSQSDSALHLPKDLIELIQDQF